MRQLGAHVHGAAQMSVAIDASGLVYAELTSPAWNLYGFEAAPQSDAQRETVRAVAAALSEHGPIAFPGRAGCTLSEVQIAGGVDGEAELEAEVEGHGHDHDHDQTGHDHHDDHFDHDHDHADHDDHAHQDVTVSWTYQCERAEAADRFDAAGLFAALPRLETLQAEAFDGRRAAVRMLTPGAAAFRLE
jgi:hypothetical protein